MCFMCLALTAKLHVPICAMHVERDSIASVASNPCVSIFGNGTSTLEPQRIVCEADKRVGFASSEDRHAAVKRRLLPLLFV